MTLLPLSPEDQFVVHVSISICRDCAMDDFETVFEVTSFINKPNENVVIGYGTAWQITLKNLYSQLDCRTRFFPLWNITAPMDGTL